MSDHNTNARNIPTYIPPHEQQMIYVRAMLDNDPGPYPDVHAGRACRVVAKNRVGQYYIIPEQGAPRWVPMVEVTLGQLITDTPDGDESDSTTEDN